MGRQAGGRGRPWARPGCEHSFLTQFTSPICLVHTEPTDTPVPGQNQGASRAGRNAWDLGQGLHGLSSATKHIHRKSHSRCQ